MAFRLPTLGRRARTGLRLSLAAGLLALSGLSYLLYQDLIESADAANKRLIESLTQERGQLAQLARTLARVDQVQRGIQFRELETATSLFQEITPNLDIDRIYLVDRDGGILTEHPVRAQRTDFLPDAQKKNYQVREPFSWVLGDQEDQLLVTAMVRHPIERSMLGYIVLERTVNQRFVNRIAQESDAEWVLVGGNSALRFASQELWVSAKAPVSLAEVLDRDGYRWRTNRIDIMPESYRVFVGINQSNLNLLLLALVLALPVGLLWFLQDQRQRTQTMQAELNDVNDELLANRTELEGAREDLMRTLSERALANQAKRDAQLSLVRAERLASIGQMVSSIGHDMANPVSAIAMIAISHQATVQEFKDLLYSNLDDSEGAQEFRAVLDEYFSTFEDDIETFQTGSNRLKEMLGALRKHGRKDDEKCVFTFDELAKESVLLSQARVVPHLVEIHVPEGLEGFGHRSHLGQVVMNFLANAADALNNSRTSPQESEGKIFIEARALGTTWEFSVSDNGPGLPPEIAKEVFEPYFTTKSHTEGTGLGLAIAHTIIQEHEGSVRVDRHPTLGGARFLVRLPRVPVVAE